MQVALAVHGHFYQPPRENPWTEEVSRELSAAPFHDWNERIAAESYRPNAFARVVDEWGRVEAVVNNYRYLSFDVGPTLLPWLEENEPETYDRIVVADAEGGGGMAQAFIHLILPLATEREMRTQIRWGLADFEHRFGRRAAGLWLPECAVNAEVMAVLADEGVAFTVLAPGQARRFRPLNGGDDQWTDGIDTTQTYRWVHPGGQGRAVDVVFYDGGLSHSLAFEMTGLSSQAFLDRVEASAPAGLVTVAADGETFGHHHRWGERLLAHALTVEAPRRGLPVTTVEGHLRDHPPAFEVEIHESSWSCAHGVGRWREDCGCSTGGQPGWNQQWRAPLRQALDSLRSVVDAVWERRGAELKDAGVALDEYVRVMIGAVDRDEFARSHTAAGADLVAALTLLELQRHAMAMYTSCGWFFNDLAGIETQQVLRYAGRVIDLLVELGEPDPEPAFLEVLAKAESNVADEGNGAQIWVRHVVPARVDAARVVAHLALIELLEGHGPPRNIGAYIVTVADHDHASRGTVSICSGGIELEHRRTGRRSRHVYAAVHLGGLEVLGATRAADVGRDEKDLTVFRDAFNAGAPVTELLRRVSEDFGPLEFDLSAALPDAAEQILVSAARKLSDRFAEAYERLFADHRHTLVSLAAAGYELPPVLRAPAELALAIRFESSVLAAVATGSSSPRDYRDALNAAREAEASGVRLDVPAAVAALERLLVDAIEGIAFDDRAADHVAEALAVINLINDLGVTVPFERAQEWVYEATRIAPPSPGLRLLAAALGLAQ